MDKEDMVCVCVCMYMYIYIKWNITQPSKRMKYCIAPVWMDLECQTEWSKSDREGEIQYGISYVWNIKRNDTNELLTKQKETHRFRE